MLEMSEECRAWILDPKNKIILDQILYFYGNAIKEAVIVAHQMAKEAGMSYKDFIEKTEKEAALIGKFISEGGKIGG